jgi:hypothetical protein
MDGVKNTKDSGLSSLLCWRSDIFHIVMEMIAKVFDKKL